jgi:hypothetical protein
MTVLAALFVVAGAALIGLGQRMAGSQEIAPQVLGAGVVLLFGGVALASFRSGDRAPVVIIGAVTILVVGFGVGALRRRRRPGSTGTQEGR